MIQPEATPGHGIEAITILTAVLMAVGAFIGGYRGASRPTMPADPLPELAGYALPDFSAMRREQQQWIDEINAAVLEHEAKMKRGRLDRQRRRYLPETRQRARAHARAA